ncbi:serine hydrolase [Raineyella fluvialis]|uniref:Serine hydrolase n=1 Tax=Raineyella fluvialis TaxID=2662261 RepID=A0A5Q2FCL0_9ACTN|nr:serine hydrolase [Raineyella fluvialis]QGF22823.1 serine hydrolase [Raineyella fluvialis]
MPQGPDKASRHSPGRRSVLKALGTGALGLAALPALSSCSDQAAAGAAGGSPSLLPAPEQQVPPLLDDHKVGQALAALDRLIQDAMTRTGVPGIAAAVVHQDKVVYLKGFGVREVGKPDAVGPDTVFQLASVSKPLASTVLAAVAGQGKIAWTDPVVRHHPAFSLHDPSVTSQATFVDLLSHRSGLHTGAGDLLEDLGFDQDYILGHLNQEPLDTFRSSYHYSNFGYTWAGVAGATAMGMSWEDLASKALFTPLGMTSTSYRHRDYEAAPDKARPHVRADDKSWVARYTRDADAEAPAGGASSSVRDLAEWIRLQLGSGSYAGKQVVDADALAQTHVPQNVTGAPATPGGRTHFYAMGWNVSYDDKARLQLSHAGAFNLGAATSVSLLPGEQLGIVVLTNGRPEGIPDAISSGFFDIAQNGKATVDWLGFFGGLYGKLDASEKPEVDYSQAPATATPARANSAYVGTYANSYYGPLTVAEDAGALVARLGPAASPTTLRLTHYTADTFSFASIGENANGLAGAIFAADASGRASSVRLDFYDRTGLGTFVRSTGSNA